MGKIKELLLFLLVALVLSLGWALRCYHCDSKEIAACGKNFKAYQFSAIVCSSSIADIKCGKQVQEPDAEGWVGVIRGCYTPGSLAELNDSLGCRSFHHRHENFTAVYCFCDTDYCNRASPLLAPTAAGPLTSLLYGACAIVALSACAPSCLAAAGVTSLEMLQFLGSAVAVVRTTRPPWSGPASSAAAKRAGLGRESGGQAPAKAGSHSSSSRGGEKSQAVLVVVSAAPLPVPDLWAAVANAAKRLPFHPPPWQQRSRSSLSATATPAPAAETTATRPTAEAEMPSDDRGIFQPSHALSATRSNGEKVLTAARTVYGLPPLVECDGSKL